MSAASGGAIGCGNADTGRAAGASAGTVQDSSLG
jgi:hypothetical protein